ncbi:MAG: hypothetical protein QF408_12670, partial [Pirellulales bacterium]|nr:hypothetical protein [Pirellulales bacterium]
GFSRAKNVRAKNVQTSRQVAKESPRPVDNRSHFIPAFLADRSGIATLCNATSMPTENLFSKLLLFKGLRPERILCDCAAVAGKRHRHAILAAFVGLRIDAGCG